tara:strand:- start:380 stop:832 length:453 start_codon:yes stop_codon:yes gene_type:complete
MDNPFPATLKITTGEEILAEVIPSNENGVDFFLVSNPIVISETMSIDSQKGVAVSGLVPMKWMMYANDDMTIIYKQHVISISELDKFGAEFYNKALIAAKISSPIKRKVETKDNIGFIGKVNDSRTLLENIFDSSPNKTIDDTTDDEPVS